MLNHKYNKLVHPKLSHHKKEPEKIKDYQWLIWVIFIILFLIIF